MHGVYPFTSILTVSSIVLFLFLTSFQHLGYLPKQVRQFFHNFSSLIVVIALSAAANQFNINIRYLQIPESFAPDNIRRTNWFVSPMGNNEAWTFVLAALPALILSLIIFIEQQLSGRYINHQITLLKKGSGYHLDIAVVCVGVFISSLFGLPFCVASIMLSVNNVQALTTQGGRDDFIGCDMKIKEQRVSSLLVYILVALTPTMRPMLRFIPFAVLYGLIIVALFRAFARLQFTKRLTRLFMPKEKRPDIRYLRQVPIISVNIFTVSQVLITVVLCVLRGTPAVLVFPIMVIILVGTRSLLERYLPIRDILALDEPLPPIRCPWKKRTESNNIEVIEKGALIVDESHEDVLPDVNKDLDRVNISEELSKTAAWKQLTYAENNSPLSNSSPIDSVDGKKRRRKRSRSSVKNGGKDSSPLATSKTAPVENSELIELLDHRPHDDDASDHHLQPWMNHSNDDESNTRNNHSKHLPRQGSEDRLHGKKMSRQGSEDRNAIKRQRSKDRNSIKGSKGSSSSKRHDRKQDRRNSSHKQQKAHPVVEETALPPWEQPYHSPPRKDFGLLHIPTNDHEVAGVDPRITSIHSVDMMSPSENSTRIEDPLLSHNDFRKQSDGSLMSDSPRKTNRERADDSCDASGEN